MQAPITNPLKTTPTTSSSNCDGNHSHPRIIKQTLTFDDVLLQPAASAILPSEASVKTRITRNISLNIPLVASAMDTVTESAMAIAMAQNGGIGCVHKNISIRQQVEEVKKVKKFESGMVVDPITISPRASLKNVLDLMLANSISGIPVVDDGGVLRGIITNRDVRFATDLSGKVADFMTRQNLITVQEGVSTDFAKKLLHENRIEKLIVVDADYKCVGLITVKDIEKSQKFPDAVKDASGRLCVAAAISPAGDFEERLAALLEAETDIITIDSAHGHSKGVLDAVGRAKKITGDKADIIGGNIATYQGAKALADAGADAVKVGVGPGSICTTRIVAGIGVPQLTAVMEAKRACDEANIPLIADGGIKYSGDIAKAIAAGADCVMIGSLFAGTDESPGDIVLYQGRSYKEYRGMGSLGAMARGSADRYFQQDIKSQMKYVPEGVEARVPYKGKVADVIHQLVGGLKASMGYTGNGDICQMQRNSTFVQITNAGLRESHTHDVTITQEAPNYRQG